MFCEKILTKENYILNFCLFLSCCIIHASAVIFCRSLISSYFNFSLHTPLSFKDIWKSGNHFPTSYYRRFVWFFSYHQKILEFFVKINQKFSGDAVVSLQKIPILWLQTFYLVETGLIYSVFNVTQVSWAWEQSRKVYVEVYINGRLCRTPKDHSMAQTLCPPYMHLQDLCGDDPSKRRLQQQMELYVTLSVCMAQSRCMSTSASHCRHMLKWLGAWFLTHKHVCKYRWHFRKSGRC